MTERDDACNDEGQEARPSQQSGSDRARLEGIVEALLFSSDRPVSAGRLAQVCGAKDGREVRSIVKRLQEHYDSQGRSFCIEEIAGGFQLLTRPEFAPWVSQLQSRQQQESMSQAALETLAIVAYRQPITRAEVEDIRGVQCGHMLRSLAEKRLVRVVGRSDELGRPMLYGTTRQFMQVFGLRSLRDLPKKSEFAAVREPAQARPEAESEPPQAGPEAAAPEE